MKIQINENETYELSLPTIISVRELNVIINKLQSIFRIASKIDIFDNKNSTGEEGGEDSQNAQSVKSNIRKNYSSPRKDEWEKLKTDRVLFVKIFNMFYNTEGETELKKLFKDNNISGLWKDRNYMSSNQWARYKLIHSLKPSECNLKMFPTKQTRLSNHLRIKPIQGLK